MAPADEPEWLFCYKNALANFRFGGYIVFEELAQQWIRVNLAGLMAREVARLLYEHVRDGGQVHQVKETRAIESRHVGRVCDFHYDLRVMIGLRSVYFETLLFYDDPCDPDDPLIYVVNVHDV